MHSICPIFKGLPLLAWFSSNGRVKIVWDLAKVRPNHEIQHGFDKEYRPHYENDEFLYT